MNKPTIRTLSASDQDAAVAAIVAAFIADPIVRYVFSEPQTYLTYMPPMVRAFGGRAFENGTAFGVEGNQAAALWLPPGVGPDDETMGALLEEAITDPERKHETYSFTAQMAEFHPSEPHWYLPLIGVDPAKHGLGLGSALLAHTLAICDQAGETAYLEATSPRNVPLYERHSFEALGVIQAGSSPPMVPMLRRARS
jgi:GNAT superfamily N-acetyltransferase